MIKQIAFLLVTLVLGTHLIFFTSVFSSSFSDEQVYAFKAMVKLYLIVAISAFVISELVQNYSQVDKLWSTIPIAYTWYFAVKADLNPRMVIMASVATLWGVRLTLNFVRRGGIQFPPWRGEEDYRWAEIKKATPVLRNRFFWGVFNLFFVCLYQLGVIFLFSLPILAAWQGADNPLNWLDYLLAGLMIMLIVLETIADQQQYNYQTEKYRRINAKEELGEHYGLGFVSTGLWSVSRHPNYFCEQSIWVIFYLMGAVATGQWLNWSIGGPVLLIILFNASANFSEKISAGKYSEYAAYIRNVPKFFPLFKVSKNWKSS